MLMIIAFASQTHNARLICQAIWFNWTNHTTNLNEITEPKDAPLQPVKLKRLLADDDEPVAKARYNANNSQ